jgi:hypothetical protein
VGYDVPGVRDALENLPQLVLPDIKEFKETVQSEINELVSKKELEMAVQGFDYNKIHHTFIQILELLPHK